ncbi:ABC transporter permease [Streptomyces anulatus]|uniref:ABC transporter permease n=1 Tax=Streptomyces anulatus TaxID=1892 RepID=UPI00365DD274
MSIVTAPPTGPGDAPAAGGPGSPALPDAPWRTTWRRLWGDRGSRTALIAAALLILVALTAPLLSRLGGWSPTAFDADAIDPYLGGLPHGVLGGISAEHWLGVEPVTGRHPLPPDHHAAQLSLAITYAANAHGVLTATPPGIAAGYFGGRVDTVLSRLMDLTMSFPSLIFMIAMMSVAQDVNRVVLMTVVIGVFGWPGIARVVRAEALSLRHREFVEAARACGSGPWRILTRQVLPNISGPVIAYTTLLIPGMISTEAALSFLGVGVRPPTPSWGQMIAEAVAYYETDPMYFIVPSVFLFVAVLAFTVLGDALRDILDPQGGRP